MAALAKAETDRSVLKFAVKSDERKVTNHATTALSISGVETLMKSFESHKLSLLDIHTRITNQAPKDIDVHEIEYEEISDKIFSATTKLLDIHKSLSTPATTLLAPPKVNIKLPELQLPSFDGRYEDWPSFEDLFKATVGNNVTLSQAQKLQYLKACVKGEASNLIKSFVITDSNYTEAWNLLSTRYNNKADIVYALTKKIYHHAPLKTESVTGLQGLINNVSECVRSLRVLGQPTDQWDTLLVVMIIEKLDSETKSEWAMSRKSTSPATFKEVIDFLEMYTRGLIAKSSSAAKPTFSSKPNSAGNQSNTKTTRTFLAAAAPSTCGVCKGSHQLQQCSQLINMDAAQRMSAVKRTTACLNCLRDGHSVKECYSKSRCRTCSSKHHTLLHFDQRQQNTAGGTQASSSSSASAYSQPATVVRTNFASAPVKSKQRMFKTAVVDIVDNSGIKRPCRVIFDDCSEAEYITEKCASALGLTRTKTDVIVEGVGEVETAHCKSMVSAELHSRHNRESVVVENLLVMPRITGYVPRLPCDRNEWTHIQGIELADPNFDKPGEVDILLGTGIVSYIMRDGIKRGRSDQPVAYNSVFGWTISGIVNAATRVVRTHHTTCRLEEMVQRFWDVEQIPTKKLFTPEEEKAEKHFIETHTRKPDGRYVVRLPFNEKIHQLGESRELALQRFLQLERRFKKNPSLKQQYCEFMQEYIQLGHMELVTDTNPKGKRYYIPHHFVRKEDSTTTKLRVVFDASMKTSSGISLNDTLLVGPTIQEDLFTQVVSFRTYLKALKSDVAKMYRQFEVHEDDRDYQIILWRENPEDPLLEYRLKTVTYGESCAPFLATRCLVQLADDEGHRFPNAAKALKEKMFVDDFIGGEQTTEKSLKLFEELIQLCASAQLQLRKWCSSDKDVLDYIPSSMQEANSSHEFSTDTSIKALGIQWNPKTDHFHFHVPDRQPKQVITKREVLSEIAKTFDPIGWITPTTIIAKILFQDLWKESTDWDKQVSEEIKLRWDQYCQQLKKIEDIRIPRCIIPVKATNYQLHCFADSSEKAMACSLYLRTVDSTGNVRSHLITSKTKIAPIKQINIPRLELNAAVLMAETVEAVIKCFEFSFTIHAWTDSMITMCWITSPSRRWKTYVATRVATITDVIPARCWNHVRSADNPADLPSRGVLPEDLLSSNLWWHGPPWLTEGTIPSNLEVSADEDEVSKEERLTTTTLLTASQDTPVNKIFKFSTLSAVVATVGWILRFWNYNTGKSVLKGPLTASERRHSLFLIIKYVQQVSFHEDYNKLRKKKQVSSRSKLAQLNPYLNEKGLICVGGRLVNAEIHYNSKHPIVLPHNHQLTTLIIRQQHIDTSHGGFSLTLSLLRRQYWVLRGRDIVRHVVRKCTTCRRVKAAQSQQMMGNLPTARVTETRPFSHCGVDFAGSFGVRMRRGRGAALDKCYMAVFVCFSTKAVHLEVVTSLSTPDFIAAFKRFTARRGIPSHMYSDCGTNFVGADKELKKMLTASLSDYQQQVTAHGTTWTFNPPAAPHQGGLWEAAVKAAKYHLKRISGTQTLTMEQFQTLLCNVEACLNSRPLCPLSSDPLDLDALTPGHFLVGAPLLAVPEGDVTSLIVDRLDHWQKVQHMTQHFWKRWREEYLVTLQQRQKWNTEKRNIQVGDLVIVREDNLPPTKWKLGRVISTNPGSDGLVRKATIRTSNGELTRPIIKLSVLLTHDEN